MAYISKEEVKEIRQRVKKTFPKPYKISITRRHGTEVIIALMEGPNEIEDGYQQLNHYYPDRYEGEVNVFLRNVLEILDDLKPNYNRNAGDMGADYADYNYFRSIHIGKWDKPYKKVLDN